MTSGLFLPQRLIPNLGKSINATTFLATILARHLFRVNYQGVVSSFISLVEVAWASDKRAGFVTMCKAGERI